MRQSPWKLGGRSSTSRPLPSCLQQWPSNLLWKCWYLRASAIGSEIRSLGARTEAIMLRRTDEGILIKPARGLPPDSRLGCSYRPNYSVDMQQLQSLFGWFGPPEMPPASQTFLGGAQRASRSADWNSGTRHRNERQPLRSHLKTREACKSSHLGPLLRM